MSELTFRKLLLYKDPCFLSVKAITKYEIYNEKELVAFIEVKDFIHAKIYYKSKWLYIQPLSKFINTTVELLSEEEIKFGEIHVWGWTLKKQKLFIKDGKGFEEWEFNHPYLIHNNQYKTSLKNYNETIVYEFKLGIRFRKYTSHYCLREITGTINYEQSDELVAILGIYLNEQLLLKQNMD